MNDTVPGDWNYGWVSLCTVSVCYLILFGHCQLWFQCVRNPLPCQLHYHVGSICHSLVCTGCPRKQFTLFDNALILKLFIARVRYYTHFEADIASFKMSTHTLHRCK